MNNLGAKSAQKSSGPEGNCNLPGAELRLSDLSRLIPAEPHSDDLTVSIRLTYLSPCPLARRVWNPITAVPRKASRTAWMLGRSCQPIQKVSQIET